LLFEKLKHYEEKINDLNIFIDKQSNETNKFKELKKLEIDKIKSDCNILLQNKENSNKDFAVIKETENSELKNKIDLLNNDFNK
jgi:hypothetical protein